MCVVVRGDAAFMKGGAYIELNFMFYYGFFFHCHYSINNNELRT